MSTVMSAPELASQSLYGFSPPKYRPDAGGYLVKQLALVLTVRNGGSKVAAHSPAQSRFLMLLADGAGIDLVGAVEGEYSPHGADREKGRGEAVGGAATPNFPRRRGLPCRSQPDPRRHPPTRRW